MNGCAPGLALIERLKATRKWAILLTLRGVRQGGPLSPYLFLLAVETLAMAIRENGEIKGIVIDKQGTKLLQYADDTTAVLSDTDSAC